MPVTEIFQNGDMVLSTCQNGGVMSGGFLLKQLGGSQDDDQKGGGLLATLKDLAIPAGLFYASSKVADLTIDKKESGVIDDKTYESLIKSAEKPSEKEKPKKSKSKTRRKRSSNSKKSRRKRP